MCIIVCNPHKLCSRSPPQRPKDCPKVYTDASIRNKKVGIGVYFRMQGNEYVSSARVLQCKDRQCINEAELCGILYAVKQIPPSIPLTVYTDSQTSIDCIIGRNVNTRFRVLTHTIREEIFARKECTWISKVKAHSGVFGNEIADRLAKYGTTMNEERHKILTLPLRNCKIQLVVSRDLIIKSTFDDYI